VSAPLAIRLGFDADGVVVNSEPVSWRASEDILALFGPRPMIGSRADQLRLFGRQAQAEIAGADDAVLRSLHRLLMRSRANRVSVHRSVLSIVAQLACKPVMITAAYAEGITLALGGEVALFTRVMGREEGAKETLLALAAAQGLAWFVTDTRRDVERCRACGVRSIAVGWGYDASSDLRSATPDFFVPNPEQLAGTLAELGFFKPVEV
jgi:phosphoglycolate phosphatase-like HAD superfamily hydrolase